MTPPGDQPNVRDRRGGPRALAIVPARLGSTRMPRKMLRRDTGAYLFQHTVENTRRSPAIERVLLATDSEEIVEAADQVRVEALLTSVHHTSGTDRVHEAWQRLVAEGTGDWDVVVNVQGDEPELPLEDLDILVEAFTDPEVELATLCAPIRTREEALDPSVVKVVRDARGDALYFSRSAIPSFEHPTRPMHRDAPGLAGMMRHIGVYAFRPTALERFCGLPHGALEATESLEQLRWLEHGGRIRCCNASRVTFGIDTEADYERFAARIRDEKKELEGSEQR